MFDLLKPYVMALLNYLAANRFLLIGSLAVVIAVWYYFDLVQNEALSRYELVGFAIITLIALTMGRLAYRWLRTILTIALAASFSVAIDTAAATDLRVVDIEKSGSFEFDLTNPALYRFPFPLNQLNPGAGYDQPELEADCIEYSWRNPILSDTSDNLDLRFCGYGDAFEDGISSIIVDPGGIPFYAYDLINLERGGGGNFGRVLEIPNTSLSDYLDQNQLTIEHLARAILTENHADYKDAFTGYGMYGFVLFRENSRSGFERRREVVESFLSILPDIDAETFGIERRNMGVLILPTTLSDDDLYLEANVDSSCFRANQDRSNDCQPAYFVDNYNYSYARFALRALQEQTNISIPEISVVFVPFEAADAEERFFLSRFNWTDALVFNLDDDPDVEGFFVDLNNALAFGFGTDEDINLIGSIRKFAESTGRLAMIALGQE
jgi:hypothetical protein